MLGLLLAVATVACSVEVFASRNATRTVLPNGAPANPGRKLQQLLGTLEQFERQLDVGVVALAEILPSSRPLATLSRPIHAAD